jgi:hypothetical protein
MPRRSLVVLVALAFSLPAGRLAAQTAEDSVGVRRAVADYVEGFYEGDSTKHVRSVRPDVFKYGFWLPRDSTRYQGEAMPWMVSSVLWQSRPRAAR